MDRNPKPWTVSVIVEDIPETGGHYELAADAAVREAIAKIAGLRALPKLEVVFDLARRGAGVRVTGQLQARVGQNCVVTLDPIETDFAESIDVTFAPPLDEGAPVSGPVKKGQEPPEPLLDDVVDLGALATEFLILGLDPYPRKAGVECVAPEAGKAAAHPFSALEVLKKQPGNQRK